VSWAVGDQIVLASTDFNQLQAEQRSIATISGTTITFTPALVYEHFASLLNAATDTEVYSSLYLIHSSILFLFTHLCLYCHWYLV
jgi:hypothetical protein